jgi:large subunit ribosomal protein L23Ae
MVFVRPDGKKKAYVRLTPDHDALDVANKVWTGIYARGGALTDDVCVCVQIGFI